MKRKLCFLECPCPFGRPFLGTVGTMVAIVILCLISNTVGYTQGPLAIGDKLPSDISVPNVIHHSSGVVRTGDFRGKLLILDFWATWCSPCMAMMPKSDSLQKAFGADVQFLPVTSQKRSEVERALGKAPKLKSVSLPFAVGDTTLSKLFPHQELPHYVWIDRSGTVVAITDHREVNAATIQKMLSQSALSLSEKRDAMRPYDREAPLLFQGVGLKRDDVVFQSLLTDYVEGLQSRFDVIRDVEGRIQRVTMTNAWVQLMFALAYSDDTRYFSRNRIVLEVQDPEKVISKAQGEEFRAWLRGNSWCYELMLPSQMSKNAFEIMRSDMNRLFPQYKVAVEKRTMACLVLLRTSSVDKIATHGALAENSTDGLGLFVNNAGTGMITSELNHYLQHLNKPVIDGTGYTGNVDIGLDATLSNVEDIRRALAVYDLDLIERTQEIEVLVIRDTP